MLPKSTDLLDSHPCWPEHWLKDLSSTSLLCQLTWKHTGHLLDFPLRTLNSIYLQLTGPSSAWGRERSSSTCRRFGKGSARAGLDSPEEPLFHLSRNSSASRILELFSLFGTVSAVSETTTESEKNLSRHRLPSIDSHCHIKAPLQTNLQTSQAITPSSPVPAPARGSQTHPTCFRVHL